MFEKKKILLENEIKGQFERHRCLNNSFGGINAVVGFEGRVQYIPDNVSCT